MKIELTKKQYESLAKLVYLGNWMANAQRTGASNDPILEEYDEMATHVYSLAKDFGLGDDFESDLEFTDDLEPTDVSRLHEEYDERNLWEELPEMLGERDFFKKYSLEERFIKLMECSMAWEDEFEKHGLERIQVMK